MAPTHTAPWQKEIYGFQCGEKCRSRDHALRAAAQFDVDRNPRYTRNQQGHGETYCNIFVWDFTRAMGCEIPHWMGKKELSALGIIRWLENYGDDNGWSVVPDQRTAMELVALGLPVLAVWENTRRNSEGHPLPSHVAALLPPTNGECRIAQAGRDNLWDVELVRGFGSAQPTFWSHP